MRTRVPFFDLKKQYALIENEIQQNLKDVFSAGHFVGGKEVRHFEEKFCHRLGSSHCLGVGNGTDAIFIALKALGIGPGDEVITPAWSWISTSETITLAGAKPVFVDVDEFFTINVKEIPSKITAKTRAVIAVHLYGQMADVEKLKEICDEHHLFLIEDCAQAHFSSYKNKSAGTWGHFGTFSFYPTKNLGAYGDGGALVTEAVWMAEKARRLANHGGLSKDEHEMEGFNSRLDSLQASVLATKLKYIDQWTQQRIENAAFYASALRSNEAVQLPRSRESSVHTFHLYVIRSKKRDRLKNYLEQHGIETQIHYPKALPFEPAYKYLGHSEREFPVSTRLQSEVLSLPIYPELTTDERAYVAEKINDFNE